MTTGPLGHLRVVELCDGVPVAWCGRQLATWGAEVVHLEPPGGSWLRDAPPLIDGAASLRWAYVMAGKAVATLDADARDMRRRCAEVVEAADVLLTDWAPERLAAAGLDPSELTRSRPELVVLAYSEFGRTGPYAGYQATDLVHQALTGYLSFNGKPGRPPLKAPAAVVAYACGVCAFLGVLAAVDERTASGRGQLVEVRALEAVASLVHYLRTQYFGQPAQRKGGVGPPMLPCADGHLFMYHLFEPKALLDALGIEEALAPEQGDPLHAFLAEHTRTRRARELFEELSAAGQVAGYVQDPAELVHHEQLEDLGFFTPVRIGSWTAPFPGPPARMSRTPSAAPSPPRRFSGWTSPQDQTRTRTSPRKAPLDGVRVVDLTQAWLGPYATMLLADLGAEVVKVESHRRPDVWRRLAEIPPCAREHAHRWNVGSYFNSVNRNKRSLALALDHDRGRELFRDLVRDADLVMENYTPKVMDAFGLGYERLREVNPRLVMVSFSGYGPAGPYRDYKGNGASLETVSGWVSLFGYPDDEPFTMGEYPIDAVTGLHMAACAVMGLSHARRTGEGQHITGSMLASAAGYIGEEVMFAALAPGATPPRGNRSRDMVPHGVFPCAGEDQWVAVAVRDDPDWAALCSVASAEDLADPRFATLASRLEHVDEIEERITRWTRRRSPSEAMTLLQSAGVPAGAVNTTEQALADPHLAGWFTHTHHPDVGTHRAYGFPWSFERASLRAELDPPRIGEHSAEVLASVLGLGPEEIDALFEADVTGTKLEYVPKVTTS